MNKLEKTIYELERLEYRIILENKAITTDLRVRLWITLIFLICMLSLPITSLSRLILFFVYPIITSFCIGISYGALFRRSLVILPYLLAIGIFNPLLDHRPFIELFGRTITYGWISFTAIMLRGILSMQVVIILLYTSGYYGICQSLKQTGVPTLFICQLHLIYRYLKTLLQEALQMNRARQSRSYNQTSYPLKMWIPFIGQLLLHTLSQSQQIHNAMLSRGFTGSIPYEIKTSIHLHSILYLLMWGGLFIYIRLFPPSFLLP